MSGELKNKALGYLEAGFSVLPIREDKRPALTTWEDLQREAMTPGELEDVFSGRTIREKIKTFTTPAGVGIITGAVSKNLEVVDVDTKHDATGTLWEDLRELLENHLPDLFPRLTIARTRSGGYHIYYRIQGQQPEKNLKLANNEAREVIIETRGEGGYVVAYPSPGYSFIQGDPSTTPEITPEERALILSITRSFNQLQEEKPRPRATPTAIFSSSENSPFEDYNHRGDVVGLLEGHGWKVVRERGEKVDMLRPGQTDSKTSGNFHTTKRLFYNFSTSSPWLDVGAHSPAKIYTLLEHHGDYKEAYRSLLAQGYGEPYRGPGPVQMKTQAVKVTRVNQVNGEEEVISQPGEILQTENIQAVTGDYIVISSPAGDATAEILQAITLVENTGKRVYIQTAGRTIQSHYFRLRTIIAKYSKIQEDAGDLSGVELNNFLDEVVEVATRMDPIDRDLYIREFLNTPGISDLGITQESITMTVERIRDTRAKERQRNETAKVIDEARGLLERGDAGEAIHHLEKQLREVKTINTTGLIPPAMSYMSLMGDIATITPALRTGYPSLDEFIGFTPGAITLVAGRPSHGKTTFMFNLMLRMCQLPENRNMVFYFWTFEEPLKNLAVKIINNLSGVDLRPYFHTGVDLPRQTNYEFIKNYIRAGRTDIPELEAGKEKLRELIDGNRIRIIDKSYSVEDMGKILMYLNEREKIGAVFIDYIQRMSTSRRTQDKRTEIAHISDMILQTAKEINRPIILGAQFNRGAKEEREPRLEHLKEAGNLEEDANTVLSVWNESRENDSAEEGNTREVELKIKALKNREGEPGQSTLLTFDKYTGVITGSSW